MSSVTLFATLTSLSFVRRHVFYKLEVPRKILVWVGVNLSAGKAKSPRFESWALWTEDFKADC